MGGKINLHAAIGPGTDDMSTTTNRIAMPRKVSTDKFFSTFAILQIYGIYL